MATKPVNVALFGAGIFAREAHIPAIQALGPTSVNLCAIYSRSRSSAESLATFAQTKLGSKEPLAVYSDDSSDTLDALLERPDITAVIVALPITTQPEIVIRALKAGKHVLSEKPVAPDVQGAKVLIEAYTKEYKPKGLVWRVAENFEVEPARLAAAKAIREGKIGKVTSFNLSMMGHIDQESKWYKTPWRTVPDYQGGFLLDAGVHFAACLRVCLPSPMVSLSGFSSLTKEFLAPADSLNAIIKCEDGAHGTLELSFAAPAPARSSTCTTITGSEGWLNMSTFTPSPGAGTHYKVIIKNDKGGTEEIVERSCGVEEEIRYFVDVVTGAGDAGFGLPENALKDVAIIEGALKSNGSPVTLQ
jgi:predicted dehydrogenase